MSKAKSANPLFVVRPGFWVHDVKPDAVGPGTVLALTDAEAKTHAHQIEEAPEGAKEGDVIEYPADAPAPAPEAAE